jgi:hypothetical protein
MADPIRTAKKSFHLNEILSLYSGLHLAKEGVAAVHRLVAFLMETEASSYATAEHEASAKKCLEEQLPFLKELNLGGLQQIYNYDSDDSPNPYLDVWVEMQGLRYGTEHNLVPMSRWNKQKAAALATVN